MSRRLLSLLSWFSIALLVSCGDTDEVAPTTLNFNRPIDIAFACYGDLRITNGSASDPSQPHLAQAQPTQACDIRSEATSTGGLAPVPPGQENLGSGSAASNIGTSAWYGFILQSVPGTLGIATWLTQPSSAFTGVSDVTVLDADPLTPGKSGITMGVQPIGLITDTIGCYEVTANAGSCDLSALDITTALNYQADPQTALGNNQPVRVSSIALSNMAGIPMRAKPAAIVSAPPAGTIGVMCPATPTGLAYVAYPSCHLVAAIDTSSGTVVGGVQFDANGVPTLFNSSTPGTAAISCPDECSGGGQVTPGPRPTSLDLSLDPNNVHRRALAIGSENSNVVTIVELDVNSMPESSSNVVLQNQTGTLGVNQVKVSPSIGMGGYMGQINDTTAPGPQMQFLYAITNDSTVRVANIYNSVNTECDTQVDPRYLHDNKNIAFMSCMQVGGATTPPRRTGAIGPGIQLVNRMPAITTTTTTTTTTSTTGATTVVGGTAAVTVPMGIDIFEIPAVDGAVPGPTTMVGYFGVISGANGQTYILNVDDDSQSDYVGEADNVIGTAIPYDIANQVRDSLPQRDLVAEEAITGSNGVTTEVPICETDGPDPDASTGNTGGPRSSGAITVTLPTVPTSVIATAKSNELPSIRQVLCNGADVSPNPQGQPQGEPVSEIAFPAQGLGSGSGALLSVRDAEYPDVMGMDADETVTLTYEGSVSVDTENTATNGPPVRTSMFSVDATGMYLVDQTTPFCAAGAEPWDIVQIHGCDPTLGNADCPPDYDCFVHPDSQVTGIGQCMLSTEADRLASACKEFLISDRRYTIGTTTSGKLTLLPRKHVLRTTPVDGCTSNAQCAALAAYAIENNDPNNPISEAAPPADQLCQNGAGNGCWSCMLDPQRAPDLDDSGNVISRCIETCSTDADCDLGTVCQNGLCMEGIEPPQACVNAPEAYEIDVSEAFAVTGALSGFHHHVISDANGNCIQDPNGSPFNIGRIPLRAPACDPTANALGILPDGVTVEANPCETTVDQFETDNDFVTGTCTPGDPATSVVDRKADAIVFRGPMFNMTIVDPTYPGDASCIGDRGGNLGKIPIVPSGTAMAVRITGGFRPLFLAIQPALPGKVVRGPTNSIWVVDEGDYLSQDIDVASTSGKVFRIESQAIGVINVLE